MFLDYVGRHGQALIDRALYLPADWAKDEDRRREARIPADITFTTSPNSAWRCWSGHARAGFHLPGSRVTASRAPTMPSGVGQSSTGTATSWRSPRRSIWASVR